MCTAVSYSVAYFVIDLQLQLLERILACLHHAAPKDCKQSWFQPIHSTNKTKQNALAVRIVRYVYAVKTCQQNNCQYWRINSYAIRLLSSSPS